MQLGEIKEASEEGGSPGSHIYAILSLNPGKTVSVFAHPTPRVENEVQSVQAQQYKNMS